MAAKRTWQACLDRLRSQGWTPAQIALVVGVNGGTVRRWARVMRGLSKSEGAPDPGHQQALRGAARRAHQKPPPEGRPRKVGWDEALRDLTGRARMTLQEVADAIGCGESTVRRWRKWASAEMSDHAPIPLYREKLVVLQRRRRQRRTEES